MPSLLISGNSLSVLLLFLLLLAVCTSAFPQRTAPARHTAAYYASLMSESDSLGRHVRRQYELGLRVPVRSPSPARAQWFRQRLDHFDLANRLTFQQKYYVNDSLWDGKGPVIFLVGWEGPMESEYVAGVWSVNSLAEQFHGLIVCLEHRFYGESVPKTVEDPVQAVDKYLSSVQAIEDAAQWAMHINRQYNVTAASKWVAVGGSYSGFLAGALRLKSPHLFAMALAISGPVQATVDYTGYNDVVSIALGSNCSDYLRAGNERVTALLSTPAGQAQLAQDFSLCTPVNGSLEQAMLISTWSYDIGGVVQYASPGSIARFCDKLVTAGSGDPYQSLIQLWFPPSNSCNASPSFDAMVRSSLQPGEDFSWGSQTCNEVGYFQTGSSRKQPFSALLTLELSLRWCDAVYNVSRRAVYENVAATNTYYGGFHIDARHVVYSNGQLDPWHRAAVFPPNTGGEDNVVFLIDAASHCTDIEAPREEDSASLRKLRQMQSDAIRRWAM